MKRLISRKFERKRFVRQATVRPLQEGTPFSAQVLDFGQSGLAMFAIQCLPTGQLVEIMFCVTQPEGHVGLDKRVGRVVRSRAHPDGNVMGIAFAQPLGADEMKFIEANWVRS
jgi:hypothetical protein